MKSTDSKTTPEAVFFHELGHALNARFTGSIDNLPASLLKYLSELCLPKMLSLPAYKQIEVFTDVLGMGMMYESPFEEYDPFFRYTKATRTVSKK